MSVITPVHLLGVPNHPRVSALIHYLWVCPPKFLLWGLCLRTTLCLHLGVRVRLLLHLVFRVSTNYLITCLGCVAVTQKLLSQEAPNIHSPIYCQIVLFSVLELTQNVSFIIQSLGVQLQVFSSHNYTLQLDTVPVIGYPLHFTGSPFTVRLLKPDHLE